MLSNLADVLFGTIKNRDITNIGFATLT